MILNISPEIEKYRYVDIEPTNEEVLITISDRIILSSKNMFMLSGAPKSNKSTVFLMFLMSFLSGKSLNGISVKKTGKSLYIDTELSNLSFFRAFQRAKAISGVKDSEIDFNLYDIFLFRMLDKKEILQNIIVLLEQEPDYKYLYIDGLLDLTYNYNDVEETKQLLTLLQTICEKFDVSLLTICHLAKTTGSSLGHLGSTASRKMESCVNCKVENSEMPNVVTITPQFLRSDAHFNDIRLNMAHLIADNNKQTSV